MGELHLAPEGLAHQVSHPLRMGELYNYIAVNVPLMDGEANEDPLRSTLEASILPVD